MDKETLEQVLDQFKESESSYPFGPEALVYKVMGKMFALVAQLETPARVTLKCLPNDGAILVDQFESITPGYHMNKKHWITISLTDELPEPLLLDLVDKSYQLVVSKLTKRDQAKLKPI